MVQMLAVRVLTSPVLTGHQIVSALNDDTVVLHFFGRLCSCAIAATCFSLRRVSLSVLYSIFSLFLLELNSGPFWVTEMLVASVVLRYWWLFLLMSTSLLGIYRTYFLGAMSVISYSPHRLRARCPSRVHCKQLHEYCPSFSSAGCHRPYVSCCRGSRAGRLHRLITSSGLDQSCDEPTGKHITIRYPIS